MRVALMLVMVSGCSLLIPDRMWHPTTEDSEDGRMQCPSYVYPSADAVFGVPALVAGGAFALDGTKPSRDFATAIGRTFELDLAIVGLVAGTLWTASSVYGFTRGARCHRELTSRYSARPGG